MKKYIAWFLGSVLVMSIVGCLKKENADFVPDTVQLCQLLSSQFPPNAISDPATVNRLWNLYQSFVFDGTANTLNEENIWSISVTFTNTSSRKAEGFRIHQGGLCVLDGDYETYHILVNGEGIYSEFLKFFQETETAP